ncbi:MAG: alpha/beta hydrolase [Chloroflexota bacterium]|nr:alpha/beta hydrolase [Chloroflexota bacterium]
MHAGSGPFVLLVHGFLSSRAQWLANLESLSQVARPVVVELFGHGRSPSPEEPAAYAPSNYVAEFERIREILGVDRWLLCGQSLGAALSFRYALDCPRRISAHIFTNSMSALAEDGWPDRVRPGLEAQARRLAEGGRGVLEQHPLSPLRNRRLSAVQREAFAADSELLEPSGIARTGLFTIPASSVRWRVGSNSVPTLLVVGEREKQFAPYRRFAETEMPMLTVAAMDAGHAPNLDAAESFNEVIVGFVRGQPLHH